MAPTRTIGFRPLLHSDAEFAAVAEGDTDALHRRQGPELLEMWRNTEEAADVERFAVQVDGVDYGWTSLVKPHDSAGDAVWLHLVIPGQDERVLDVALAFAEKEAAGLRAGQLLSPVWESQIAAFRVLKRRGYEQKAKQRFWRLELAPNAPHLFELRATARQKVESHGLKLAVAADLGGEAIYPALHAVHEATGPDIPSIVPHTPEPYAAWLVWMKSTGVSADRVWVASAAGKAIGYSYLAYRPSLVVTGFTGVLREHRNKGVARALKLETLVEAIDLGVQAVETDNDFENAPILHINEELGYRAVATRVEFCKTV